MGVFVEWRAGWGAKYGRVRGYTLDSGTTLADVSAEYVLTPSQVLSATLPIPLTNLRSLCMRSDCRVTVTRGTAAVNEVHTIILGGGTAPTAGTIVIKYAAGNTAAINWDANAAAIQTAYEAASWIGPGDVSVTGGPMPSSTVYVEFTGALAGTNIAASTPPHIYSGMWVASPMLVDTLVNGSPGSVADSVTLQGWPLPLIWTSDYSSLLPCPFTADVSALTLTNLSSTRNARVQIRARYES